MPDGVPLYTYGAAPAGGGSCPIILTRTPYVQDAPVDLAQYAEIQRDAIQRGYAVLTQHCRGCGRSEGEWIPYEAERADGLAWLDWVRTLPFYNGEIFLSGGSYPASVHLLYIDTNPADVKGAVLCAQDCNRYNILYRNGFFKWSLHGR